MDKGEVINKLRELQKKKKKILTSADIQEEKRLHHYLYQYYDSIADALEDAGLESSVLAQRMRMSDDERLRILYELGRQIGKRPRHKDIRNKGWYKIFNKFGSLEEAYEKALAKYGSIEKKENTQKILPDIADKAHFYGAAAEYFVIAELLYWGFIAQKMPVDLGLDVYATKGEKIFFFQVKNVSFDKSSSRHIPITLSSFLRNESSRIFYVFIIQKERSKKALIFNYQIMLQLKKENYIKEKNGKDMIISLKLLNNSVFVFDKENSDRRRDMTNYLNDWGSIV